MDLLFPVLCSSKPMKPGSENLQRIPITTNVFKLGRGHHNTVILPYKCLSKDHCIFKKAEEEWILENCSYSSIKVNGNKLRKGETRKLCDQDIIKLDSTNELVYTFMENAKANRKRRKHDDDLLNDNVVRKKSVSPKSDTQNKIVSNDTQIVKEQIMSEQSKEEKAIYDDYAARVEKLKGSKKVVKRQKGLLRMRRNTQLELVRVKMEEKMAFLMARETEPLNENKLSKEPSIQGYGDQKGTSRENLGQSEARREQDRLRVKEKKELRKLRRETRQLKLDKEKKLKELEKQKLLREKELQEELIKVNKKLAKERELHEKEKMRVQQLLHQKKELKKVSPSTSSDSKLDIQSELQCSICSELFVRATTLGCSHSFCRYCIRKWTANKKQCPICRATITSECRCIVLDSLVDKMADTEEARRKRQELVKARDELEAKEPTVTLTRATNQHNPFVAIRPEFMYDEYSDSSHHERESSLEPDSDMLVAMDSDWEPSGFDESASNVSDEEFEEGYEEYESESQENENYDEAPENDEEEEEHDGSEENYDEGEHSPSENDEQEEHDTEDYNEGDETAPENDEGENSASENDEGENSASENDEGENSASENDEGENSASENYDEEQSAPEYDGEEISEPENYEEHSEPDDNDGDNSEPEEYDEGDHSAPDYDEGDNSGPENYDEDENSAPGDSYPDDDGDNDDYY